jgi:hypothetical protein
MAPPIQKDYIGGKILAFLHALFEAISSFKPVITIVGHPIQAPKVV